MNSFAGTSEARHGVEARAVAVALTALLGFVAVVLLWRRLVGALDIPLSPLLFVAVAATTAACGCAARFCWLAERAGREIGTARIGWWVAGISVWIVCASLVVGGTSLVAIAAMIVVAVGGEALAWVAGRFVPRESLFRLIPVRPATRPPSRPAPRTSARAESLSRGISQRLTRRDAADGADSLSGRVAAELALGQQHATIHIAFCPPFASLPRIVVERIEGPAATITTPMVVHHGVRIDVKLAAPSLEGARVVLDFEAGTE